MRVQDVLLIVCDMKGRKLEKKRVLLSQLKEFPNNPNVHPEEQVKALAQSMEQYGQYYPIVVDEDFMVLCGHGKKKALDYMGEKEADVTVMYGLSDKQKKKLLLEDNKIQDMSYVSFGDVERIIKEIGEVDIIGYTPEYLDAIINEISPDNMGVHFDEPAKKEQKFTPEKEQADQEEVTEIEQGMQSARTMVCPHCGNEITL